MKPFIYFFTAAALLILTSCQKETVNPGIEQQLIGKWKFESTILGLNGVRYVAVPSQVDIIEFKSDHTFVRTTNGDPVAHGNYDITQSKSIFTQKNDNTLSFYPEQGPPNIIRIASDTLYMAQNVYDGSSSEFSKVK
ncbi:hypothetical protein [Mucilaginibacter sp. UR6-11]|uniref:hypothetical protein n=1 Tax=Mucilaginibacter sp. UR6-11 TaxID=1435644 RepID=UPI001E326074|nr:hypothetical protein [Mucilaginibacter sp. UR6-11]MCC8426094.1 hypothetical protein [Mucilaginibacter sp. UR6-11]